MPWLQQSFRWLCRRNRWPLRLVHYKVVAFNWPFATFGPLVFFRCWTPFLLGALWLELQALILSYDLVDLLSGAVGAVRQRCVCGICFPQGAGLAASSLDVEAPLS